MTTEQIKAALLDNLQLDYDRQAGKFTIVNLDSLVDDLALLVRGEVATRLADALLKEQRAIDWDRVRRAWEQTNSQTVFSPTGETSPESGADFAPYEAGYRDGYQAAYVAITRH